MILETETGDAGLAYFGKMTAAISHELKNCLAIMNENAGLIQDLTVLARKGRPLDPDRMDDVTGRITKQVGRADGLLKRMNAFAHSVDRPKQQIDLDEAVRLAADLGARLAANRVVEIRPEPSPEPVTVTVPFFSLLNLIWQTMEAAMTVMPSKTKLAICIREEDGIRICFSCSSPFETDIEVALDACRVKELSARGFGNPHGVSGEKSNRPGF